MTCPFKVRGIHSMICRDWLHGPKGILLQGCQNSFVVFRLSKAAQTKLSCPNVMAGLMVRKRIARWMHAGFWACLTKQLLVHDGLFNKPLWPMTAADIRLIYLSTKCIQNTKTQTTFVYFLRFHKPFLTKAITDILCHFKVTSPLLIEICWTQFCAFKYSWIFNDFEGVS